MQLPVDIALQMALFVNFAQVSREARIRRNDNNAFVRAEFSAVEGTSSGRETYGK